MFDCTKKRGSGSSRASVKCLQNYIPFVGVFAKIIFLWEFCIRGFDCTNKGGSGRGSGRALLFLCKNGSFAKITSLLWEFCKTFIFVGVLYHRPWCLTVLTRVGVGGGLAGQGIFYLQKWEFCKTFIFLWEFCIRGCGV